MKGPRGRIHIYPHHTPTRALLERERVSRRSAEGRGGADERPREAYRSCRFLSSFSLRAAQAQRLKRERERERENTRLACLGKKKNKGAARTRESFARVAQRGRDVRGRRGRAVLCEAAVHSARRAAHAHQPAPRVPDRDPLRLDPRKELVIQRLLLLLLRLHTGGHLLLVVLLLVVGLVVVVVVVVVGGLVVLVLVLVLVQDDGAERGELVFRFCVAAVDREDACEQLRFDSSLDESFETQVERVSERDSAARTQRESEVELRESGRKKVARAPIKCQRLRSRGARRRR